MVSCLLEVESTIAYAQCMAACLQKVARQNRCHTEILVLRDTSHVQEEHAAEEQPAAEDQPAESSAEDAKDGQSEGGEGEPEEEEEAKPEINVRDLLPKSSSAASQSSHTCRQHLAPERVMELWQHHRVSEQSSKILSCSRRSGHPLMTLASLAQTRPGIATRGTMSTTGTQQHVIPLHLCEVQSVHTGRTLYRSGDEPSAGPQKRCRRYKSVRLLRAP